MPRDTSVAERSGGRNCQHRLLARPTGQAARRTGSKAKNAESPLRTASDVDRPGIRIAAVRGHASTIALMRLVKQASLVYAYDPTIEMLRSGNADAFASIREILIQYSAQLPGSRVLEDSYLTNSAGIATPKGNAGRLSYFSDALDELKRSGSLKRLVEEAALRGEVEVVPSNASR
jgi:polar amino acid transport system substrate-binding protein